MLRRTGKEGKFFSQQSSKGLVVKAVQRGNLLGHRCRHLSVTGQNGILVSLSARCVINLASNHISAAYPLWKRTARGCLSLLFIHPPVNWRELKLDFSFIEV